MAEVVETEMLRAIPGSFNVDRLAKIDARLTQIASDNNIRIGLAIESGSRAWGFPSPDSDYDCRFLFVRRFDDYLSPWAMRDVIETPLENELDISGWEIGKAIKLLLKGNAVVIEWLMSPIVYTGDPRWRDGLLALAERHIDRSAIERHYLHLGVRQRNTYFADERSISLKKIFYALRPAAALRWMRLHPDAQIAPMHFPTLIAQCDPPEDVATLSRALISRKAVTRELGTAPLPEPIRDFVDMEFELAEARLEALPHRLSEVARRDAAIFFRRIITVGDEIAE